MRVDRHEPVFQLYRETQEYQACREKFEHTNWVTFLEKFKGHHEGVSRAFDQTYDKESVQLGKLKLTITEATIVEATRFPSSGKKYFKGVIVDKRLGQKFLKSKHQDPDWTKGIPWSSIQEEYETIVISLHRFLTYEGSYVVTFLYHLKILLHFEGGPRIEFPHFL